MPPSSFAKLIFRYEHLSIVKPRVHQVGIRDVSDKPILIQLMSINGEVTEAGKLPENDREIRFSVTFLFFADNEGEIRS